MHRTISIAAAAVFAAGCAGNTDREPPNPQQVPAAEDLRAECAALPREERHGCYDTRLLAILEANGVAGALRALESLGRAEPEVHRDGHMFVHSIGLAAFESPETVAETFRACTPIYQSGCYHGVIQAYFAATAGRSAGGALDQAAVDALCEPYRNSDDERWILFQCLHGLGHGLTMHYDHHLPRALAGCDLLSHPWDREACYGGAFMENIVQATSPHHAVGRPAGAADDHHAGGHHGQGGQHGHDLGTSERYRALDPADPLYPCNALPDRYAPACYQMQTSAVLFANGGDFAAARELCESVPAPHRVSCFQSLGRDVSAWTVQDHRRALEICGSAEGADRAACHAGYAKNLVDLAADPGEGLRYCSRIADDVGKAGCYRAIGEELWVLSDDSARRARWCEAAEPAFRSECLAGAAVDRL